MVKSAMLFQVEPQYFGTGGCFLYWNVRYMEINTVVMEFMFNRWIAYTRIAIVEAQGLLNWGVCYIGFHYTEVLELNPQYNDHFETTLRLVGVRYTGVKVQPLK